MVRLPSSDLTRSLYLPNNKVMVRIPITLLHTEEYGPGARHTLHITVGVEQNKTGVTRHNITLVQGEETMETTSTPGIIMVRYKGLFIIMSSCMT